VKVRRIIDEIERGVRKVRIGRRVIWYEYNPKNDV
jgi:hypothetical protein